MIENQLAQVLTRFDNFLWPHGGNGLSDPCLTSVRQQGVPGNVGIDLHRRRFDRLDRDRINRQGHAGDAGTQAQTTLAESGGTHPTTQGTESRAGHGGDDRARPQRGSHDRAHHPLVLRPDLPPPHR